MKKSDFAQDKLTRAVINQIGGWTSFKNYAPDITNYGISGGFSGFIYYSDTCRFYEKNKASILELLKDQASDFGEPVVSMVASFNCLKDVSQDEILDFFALGKKSEEYTTIANALAWYAGEEIARRYCDELEG
jgi:hypothetical protein